MHIWIRCKYLLVALALVSLMSCQTPEQKAKKAEKEKEADKAWKHQDDAQDTSFKAFIGRLRKAATNKDVRTMSSMMTEDFGYNWTPGSDGYGCFKYWDDNGLWARAATRPRFAVPAQWRISDRATRISR